MYSKFGTLLKYYSFLSNSHLVCTSFFTITGKPMAKENVIEILPEHNAENPENNTQNIASNVEHTPEQKEETSRMPGFEVIYCIIGLTGVFLSKRR